MKASGHHQDNHKHHGQPLLEGGGRKHKEGGAGALVSDMAIEFYRAYHQDHGLSRTSAHYPAGKGRVRIDSECAVEEQAEQLRYHKDNNRKQSQNQERNAEIAFRVIEVVEEIFSEPFC